MLLAFQRFLCFLRDTHDSHSLRRGAIRQQFSELIRGDLQCILSVIAKNPVCRYFEHIRDLRKCCDTHVMFTGFEIADEIRQTIKFELGLTISAGVSFNKIFAKLGSDMKKPDAVTEIRPDTFREQVWPLPASDLLYVGRATEEKLRRYCIHTIGDLAQTDKDFLIRLLGVNGEKLWSYANGLDSSRVMPCDYELPIKSIGHGITCTADLVSEYEVRCVFRELSQEVGLKLRKNKLAAMGVRIAVRDNTLS